MGLKEKAKEERMSITLKSVFNSAKYIAGIIVASGVIGSALIWGFFNTTDTGKQLLEIIEVYENSEAIDENHEMRLEILELKHGGTMARVVQWNFETESWELRTIVNGKKAIYPAYISRSSTYYGEWVFLQDGLEYRIY